MKLSVVFSIFNRSNLLEEGLRSLCEQNLKDFEVVIADEMSTEDLSKVYSKFPINVEHIRFSPEGHPNYKGYHTQSLGLNLAMKHARGEVLCITQPEMVHDKENLMRGYDNAKQDAFVFGKHILTTPPFRERYLNNPMAFQSAWEQALDMNCLLMPTPDEENLHIFYWFTAFVKKEHVLKIQGVDERYMEGVYGEDDNFRNRLEMIGVLPELNIGIRSIHLNHEFEADLYKKQDRHASFWEEGAAHNRNRYFNWLKFRKDDEFLTSEDWGDPKYIKEIKEQHA